MEKCTSSKNLYKKQASQPRHRPSPTRMHSAARPGVRRNRVPNLLQQPDLCFEDLLAISPDTQSWPSGPSFPLASPTCQSQPLLLSWSPPWSSRELHAQALSHGVTEPASQRTAPQGSTIESAGDPSRPPEILPHSLLSPGATTWETGAGMTEATCEWLEKNQMYML